MENEEFRDQISTVDKKGKRIWIYPKSLLVNSITTVNG